ncbi:unnamed protein product [Owenia fusiformis]|uniref:Uncharacterized protein n=1 Tax=Owenia fusiformis TaxID=6347 RepID=A0A8J1YA46_OWEFU|nr:unnamed protein product [Owenia fusiformis]
MAKQGCKVHAFDPSINQLTHKEDNNLYFYNLGLAGKNSFKTDTKDINHPTWRLLTLSGIMQTLKIEKEKIAVLKIDIEGMEWESLRTMLSEGTLQYVKQLVLEIHIGAGDLDSVNNELLREHYSDLKWLESQGFNVFNTRKNPVSHKVYLGSKYLTHACCFELSWVNTRFNDWWGIT